MNRTESRRDPFWCGSCSTRSDDLDDYGNPRGWYRISLAVDGKPGPGDVRPGRYCSASCVCKAAMLALGVKAADVDAWLGTSAEVSA